MSGGLDPTEAAASSAASSAALEGVEVEVEVEVVAVHSSETEVRPPRWLQPMRNAVRRLPGGALVWKVLVGLVGGAILVLGLLLIPLPGPGWAIVFLGLAVWATEYAWAYRLLLFGRRTVKAWTDWVLRQNLLVRGLVGVAGLLLLAALVAAGWYFFIR
ncbi:MAG: hypothetical protein JWO63_935 [Frankiales bacterium]|jgi:uncharacterized protein (TIGR02611 family)|nr:hypothetical protein [Frankiales bacterium]